MAHLGKLEHPCANFNSPRDLIVCALVARNDASVGRSAEPEERSAPTSSVLVVQIQRKTHRRHSASESSRAKQQGQEKSASEGENQSAKHKPSAKRNSNYGKKAILLLHIMVLRQLVIAGNILQDILALRTPKAELNNFVPIFRDPRTGIFREIRPDFFRDLDHPFGYNITNCVRRSHRTVYFRR